MNLPEWTRNIIKFYRLRFDPNGNRSWFLILSLAIISAYLYSFFEWLFFITQPSYMAGSTNLLVKLSILFFSGLVISGLFGSVVIILFLVSQVFPFTHIRSIIHLLGQIVLSFLLACLFLLLIDNFTYTMFTFGIASSAGVIRGLYTIMFFLLTYLAYFQIKPYTSYISEIGYLKYRWQIKSASILIFLSVLFFITSFIGNQPTTIHAVNLLEEKPHILLIGSDGLNASNMSAYGYERETTPNLAKFATEALLAQNAFANSNSSASSVTAMLTGKLPTTTRVVHPPDILIGNDAVEHLPGILKDQGYQNIQMALPHYVDAYTVNIRQGFDIVNNRSVNNYPVLYAGWQIGGDYPNYFITITINRIISRLKHILFIEQMVNPYDQVTTGVGILESDEEYTQQLISLLETSQDPLFVHVHYLGTHGPYYNSTEKYFAKSEYQSIPSDPDFYDDAIRDFDNYFGMIVDQIDEMGLKDKTIIIIYSDHGKDWTIQRVPWMIRFPNQEYAGEIQQNVQNIDIAPTLLDYLNLSIPPWMEGDSVLDNQISSLRRIFLSTTASDTIIFDKFGNTLDSSKISPPFYQFGKIRMIVCDQFYEVNLNENKWVQGQVIDHTAPCDPTTLPTLEEAKTEIIEHLVERDFDVSSLK